jgi:hypothetical protein
MYAASHDTSISPCTIPVYDFLEPELHANWYKICRYIWIKIMSNTSFRDQTAIYQCVFMQLRVSTVVMSNHFKYLLSKAYLLKEIVNGTQSRRMLHPCMWSTERTLIPAVFSCKLSWFVDRLAHSGTCVFSLHSWGDGERAVRFRCCSA